MDLIKIPPPFIIIGMHRSGTSLLAQTLDEAGIFMGAIKDHNYEAMHFLSLNQQTLWAADANWINPKVPPPSAWKALAAEELFFEHFRTYGRIKKSLLMLKAPSWGWKDPRNTFTLPMWLDRYPKAKVIHVWRSGEEVADSLARRNRVAGEVHDPRLDEKGFGKRLWQLYVDRARSYQKKLGANYIEIQYQDILDRSRDSIGRLEEFTGKQLYAHFDRVVKS